MTYKVTVYTDDQEEVKKIMKLVGLTPEPFPQIPVEIDLPEGRCLEISQVTAYRAVSEEYQHLVDNLTDEELNLAEDRAISVFFKEKAPGLSGKYYVMNMNLIHDTSTEEYMKADAMARGIDPEIYKDEWQNMLMEQLEEIFDECMLDEMKAAVESKFSSGGEHSHDAR